MTIKVSRMLRLVIVLVVAATLAISMACTESFATSTYSQKGNALAKYKTKDYKMVQNENWTMAKYSYKKTLSTTLTTKKGYDVTFTSFLYLRAIGIKNPQSIAITPDGKTMYVMTAVKKSAKKEYNWKGRVYKLDMVKIKKKYSKVLKTAGFTSLLPSDTDCVQIGPKFKVGHGQAMALNPVTGELWYIQKAKQVKTNLVRINTTTLKPDKEIRFKLKKSVKMGNNLAFDSDGNVYFYTRSNGGWAPKNSIKIYQGQINNTSVSFRLIMQGLRYPPGPIGQSLAYNPATDRLYLVDNGEIISVPVSKLGELEPEDVQTTVFDHQNREFEGLTFTADGQGYFLTNRPYEIMTVSEGF